MAKNKGKAETKGTETDKQVPDRQMLFAAEYILDWNGTQAAIRAGYSEKGADVQACRLLGNARVRSEIERLLEDPIGRRNEIRVRVLKELEQIAFDPGEIDINYNKEGEIVSVSRRDKLKACELLGKTAAMFVDKMELAGNLTIKKYDLSKLSTEELAALENIGAKVTTPNESD
jgi:phage terminase small subunit